MKRTRKPIGYKRPEPPLTIVLPPRAAEGAPGSASFRYAIDHSLPWNAAMPVYEGELVLGRIGDEYTGLIVGRPS